ncbi:type I polyketide synthase [Cylindrospermum sp. FACHB-282]|uniref:type I polyketide synthase n=1 Tax=Cylindrospermum sp. FACHB-282 TaxID=2692794 RepID=UPI00168614BC|nr:type I polyketide synthase [Cylindrospermum sp. FACHB-282]MBD2385955.1 YiiD C-terminal domain-containing protein [Cylindrospermum sp. FACHB-282]
MIHNTQLLPVVQKSTSFEKTFVLEKERVLTDHQVMAMAVLPGVVYLEMVIAATFALQGKFPIAVKDLTFTKPMTVPAGEPVNAELLLEPQAQTTKFQISNRKLNVIYATGTVAKTEQGNPTALDIRTIRDRTHQSLQPENIYSWYRSLGIDYGAGFRVIQSLQVNQSEGLAVLEAPASLWTEASTCYLHPALLDGALQSLGALLGLGTSKQTGTLYLPFAIEKVTVYGQVQGQVFAHVRRLESENKNSTVAKGEVCITSPDGNILVELQGVTVLRKTNMAEESISSSFANLYNFCYQLLWQPEPAPVTSTNKKRAWLVFMDELGLAEALCQSLQQAGHTYIAVKAGTKFNRIDKYNFSISPTQESAYQQLWQAVYQDHEEITGVIYLWSLTNKDFRNTDFQQLHVNVEQEFKNLLFITQALAKQQHQPCDLWLITNDSQSVTDNTQVSHPEQAALWGLARVISREYVELRCHCVDLSLQEPIAKLVEILRQELQIASSSHDVAYRGKQRWTPHLVPITPVDFTNNKPLTVRPEGVYLITGGFGGLGGEVAKLLASHDCSHLYLLGRRPLPPESTWSAWLTQNSEQEEIATRIKQVQQLQSLGVQVIPVSGDVANLAEMTALIESICNRHGQLHGIIHAAGVIQDGLLRSKSMTAISEVLRPKVMGAWVLAQASQHLNLDFLIFFSSLAALTGNVGQGDYAAANAFLDAYAAYLKPSRPAFSINWGPWSHVGMLKTTDNEQIRAMGLEAITPDSGRQLFDLALRHRFGQWAIFKQSSTQNLGEGVISLNKLRLSKGQKSTPTSTLEPQVRENPDLLKLIQSYLLDKIARTLRLAEEHINPKENFMDLGFDSIMAVQVKSSIEQDAGLTLDATLLFEFPSIIELAEYLTNQHPEAFTKLLLPDAVIQVDPEPKQPVIENNSLNNHSEKSVTSIVSKQSLLNELDRTHQQLNSEDDGDVAIIGLSCRLPGAANLTQFWQNLQLGVDAITEVPRSRWDWQKFYHPDRSQTGKTCSKWGGFMEGVEEFDPAFFGLSWREALQMDPQQRLMLEVVWETLETSGYLPEQLARVTTGVFVGAAGQEYANILKRAHRYYDGHTGSGNALSIVSNRISYLFNWTGPSMTIDTACSSSLVALNMGYQALRRKEVDVALVSGSNLILTPDGAIIFGQAGMLSTDGHCKTFDSGADGYVRGEGVGAVLLKPLAQAIRDKDNIWAVIKGAGVNHDGHSKATLTAPNPKAQRRLLENVWQQAGIDPSHLSYIEAHGTGTSLGDPIEIRGLVEAFATHTKKRAFCAIGTVKSNIGHLEPAAGIAGLIKVILALKHRQLPPTLHFQSPNPHIVFEESPFYVNDKLRQWTSTADKRLAAISSFGFGGTNAHAVLQEAPTIPVERPAQDRPAHIFTLSAQSPEALQQLVERYLEYLDQEDSADIRDICFTVNTGRTHFRHRLALVVRFQDQLADKLYIISQAANKTSLRRSLIFLSPKVIEETTFSSIVERLQQLPPSAQTALRNWCQGSLFSDKIVPHLGLAPEFTSNAALPLTDHTYVELLKELAELYCLGVEIDWQAVDAGLMRKRVVLPTYPFQRQRCWLEPVQENIANSSWEMSIHPLLGQPRSNLEGAVFEKHWHQQNSLLLQHHQVNDLALLPGASVIEFMAAATQYLQPNKTYRLSQIVFSRPLNLGASGEVWTQVLITKNSQNLNFYLRSSLENPTPESHWTDNAIAQLAEATFSKPTALDISNITARCSQLLSGEQIYQGFAKAGLNYGEALQALTQVQFGQHEVLAQLQLPHIWLASASAYRVHPVLADAALQALAVLFRQPEQSQFLYIPFAIDEVCIYNHLPNHVLSWAKLRDTTNSPGENATADVILATPEGEVLVEMKQVRLRRIRQREQVSQTPQSLLHENRWETSPINTNQQVNIQQPWLLFIEPESIGQSLAHSLAQRGIKILTVSGGQQFTNQNQHYTLNPQQPQHWQQLAKIIQQQQVQQIVHLWTATAKGDQHSLVTLEQGLERGLRSLHALILALVEEKYLPKGLNLRLVTANSQTPSQIQNPEAATSWGLLKTIAWEMPQLQTQAIEVQIDNQTDLKELVTQLQQELTSPITAAEIAYNNGQRWRRVLAPVDHVGNSPWQPQENGVYLITGGLGGIGLSVDHWLAQLAPVTVILSARSSFPATEEWRQWLQTHPQDDPTSIKIHQLQKIVALGSKLEIAQADVADLISMSRLFANINSEYGQIDGIFHTAGITQDGLLRSKSKSTLAQVLQPKVYGTWLLHSLSSQQQSPVLMVLFSSVAALTGNIGQADYAAANCYLDSFAQWRHAQGLPTLSINWGLWAETGMGQHLLESAQQRGLAALTTPTALTALKQALTLLPTHAGIAIFNQNQHISQPVELKLTAANDHPVVTDAAKKLEPITPQLTPATTKTTNNLSPRLLRQQIQEQVINVMATVLETPPEQIDPQQSFLEMGLDSILAVRAVKEIQQQTQSSFPATLLFDYPTVDALAAYLSEQPNAGEWGRNLNEPTAAISSVADTANVQPTPPVVSLTPLPPIGVPIVDKLGIEVIKQTSNGISVMLPAKPENLNHIGTIYAGAMFSLGEAVAAMALVQSLSAHHVNFVVLGVRITYQEMAINDVYCDVYLEPAQISTLLEKLQLQGEVRYTCPVAILDKWGKAICQLEVDFLLRGKSQGKVTASLPQLITAKNPLNQTSELVRAPVATANGKKSVSTAINNQSAPENPMNRQEEFAEIADTDMAIIGYSGRFPNAENLDEYWYNLANGINCIREIPNQRWSLDEYFDPDPQTPGKMYTKWGGFMKSIDEFDPLFFGISPREAEAMDPQQRLILETAWEAMEMAGYAKETSQGSSTGVFIGLSSAEYAQTQVRSKEQVTASLGLGNSLSIVANRISYQFNFKGPSLVIDTACSSSFVALNTAVRSIIQGDCETAIVGGVYVILAPESYIFFSKGGFMSPVGQCKTFDASADGYVRGEGVGVLMIKPLKQALRDRDTIHATIKSVAINQDGRSNGLTAPNSRAQVAVIKNAHKQANINPETISYIEAHGTGTDLGDPIEVNALTEVFREQTQRRQFCAIGSVKSNIGHLEPASGMASIIKVILALKHKQLPPTLNFKTPNPYINFEDTPFYVNNRLRPWQPIQGVRRAGISSFGFGGTNTHVILEEAPTILQPDKTVELPIRILTLSARNQNSRQELGKRYLSYLAQNPHTKLSDLCFSANCGRSHFIHRMAITATTIADLQAKLEAFVSDKPMSGMAIGSWESRKRPRVAFLFTGQGSQKINMARELYETQPTFRDSLNKCDSILQPYLEQSLLSVIYPQTGAESLLNQTAYTQPALFAIEYALFTLWQSYGVEPDVVLGHSVGEYVAACVAGVVSLEDGLRLIARRGQLMQRLPQIGGMAAVFTDEKTVTQFLKPFGEQVAIAAVNTPQNTVIAGESQALEKVLQNLENQGINSHTLAVSHAFHSPLMEPILDEFYEFAQTITYNAPEIPLVSNLTGGFLESGQIPDASYWRNHIRQPVLFASGIQALASRGFRIFLEIGAHSILNNMARQILPTDTSVWLHSLQQGKSDWQAILESLGQLYTLGASIDWEGFDKDYIHQRISLPTYPFNRKRYWLNDDSTNISVVSSPKAAPTPDILLNSFVDILQE